MLNNFIEDLKSIENGTELLDSIDSIKEIFHYTRIEGLKGILETNNFWVSHSSFMNDISEIKYSYQLIIDVLREILERESRLELKKFYDILLMKMEENIKKETNDDSRIFRGTSYRPSEYVLSFSLNKDSVQLWSSFTGRSGYNVGIDFKGINNILKTNRNNICIPGIVIYDIHKQRNIILKKTEEFKAIYCKYYNSLLEEDLIKLSVEYSSSMRLYSNFFKNPVFQNDEEFRIVFYNYYNKTHIKPNYRVKDNILIPFINAFNKETEIIPLKSIVVGPTNHSDLAMEGLTFFLSDLGYMTQNIDIRNSLIPLRY